MENGEHPELDIKVNETHLCESGVDAFTKPCIVSIYCLKLVPVKAYVCLLDLFIVEK